MRRGTLGLVILLSVLAAACGDDSTTNSGPAGPSSPTVTSVTITGTLAIVNLGQTSQLTATAHFAKGTIQDVSGQAAWSSSDSTIATVSATGLVTSIGVGTATITANYRNVVGSTRVTCTRPPSYTLAGAVTESVPTTSTMLSGARVEFLDGVNQGRFATTDSTGHYRLTQVPAGTYNVRAALSPGYVDTTKQVTVNADTTVDFGLAPTPVTLSRKYSADISSSSTLCYQGLPCQVFSFGVHNSGPLNATLIPAAGTPSSVGLVLQLFSVDTNQVIASASGTGPSQTFLYAEIRTPGNYQLRVVGVILSATTTFTLNATFPN